MAGKRYKNKKTTRRSDAVAIFLLLLLIAAGISLPGIYKTYIQSPSAEPTPSPTPVFAELGDAKRLAARAVAALDSADEAAYDAAQEACLSLDGGREALRQAMLSRSAQIQSLCGGPYDYSEENPWDEAVAWHELALDLGTPAATELKETLTALQGLRGEVAALHDAVKLADLNTGRLLPRFDQRKDEYPFYYSDVYEHLRGLAAELAHKTADEAQSLLSSKEYFLALNKAKLAVAQFDDDTTRQAFYAASQPDYGWLSTAVPDDYNYTILWESDDFNHNYTPDQRRITEMPQADRAAMERIIKQWAALYPPDHFNALVKEIYVYRSCTVAMKDDAGNVVLNSSGGLRWESIVGATVDGVIIITDKFANESLILRALVHEMAHVEMDYGREGFSKARNELYETLRKLNGDFEYWYERPDILSTADIPGWVSSDGSGDWRNGWARRYGQLAVFEDVTTLTEKLVLGPYLSHDDYPALGEKLKAVAEYRARLHPAFTEEFFQKELREALKNSR